MFYEKFLNFEQNPKKLNSRHLEFFFAKNILNLAGPNVNITLNLDIPPKTKRGNKNSNVLANVYK
jgi:hypothetical protein